MHWNGSPASWLAALLVAAPMSFGCSSDDSPHYGPPGGLTGKVLPPPSWGTGGGVDSGGGAAFVDASGTLPDGGSCSVSWTAQIAPAMAPGGRWKCGDSACHGGLQAPKITSDPAATYASLASYTMQFAPKTQRYVLPGSVDPTASGIECNLAGPSCGTQMPLTYSGAQALTAQDVAQIDAWVRCGAPDN